MVAARRGVIRAIAALLLVAMAWQFGSFYRDYLGRYRIASARAYDPTAFRESAGMILTHADAAAVYLPINFYDVSAKWRFYVTRTNHAPLWQRTHYFREASELAAAPATAIALLPEPQAVVPAGWTRLGTTTNIAGDPISVVIQKQ
jgi:hypothetical protein